jgi:hypothetical protein
MIKVSEPISTVTGGGRGGVGCGGVTGKSGVTEGVGAEDDLVEFKI